MGNGVQKTRVMSDVTVETDVTRTGTDHLGSEKLSK